jgi:hypothetical protein
MIEPRLLNICRVGLLFRKEDRLRHWGGALEPEATVMVYASLFLLGHVIMLIFATAIKQEHVKQYSK